MAKFVYRFPPCPMYDIEGTESWLEDQALAGLELVSYNAFGLFVFQKTAPKTIRCRLEAAESQHTIWDDHSRPPQQMLELAENYGWTFVVRYGQFYIFRSKDPDCPELNTDPGIQAMTLSVLKKRWRRGLIPMVVYLAILLFGLGPGFFYHMAAYDPLLLIFAFLFVAWQIGTLFVGFIHLARLQRWLSSGRQLTHRTSRKQRAGLYRFGMYASYVLAVVMLLFACRYYMNQLGMGEHPLTEYPGTPPFVTLEELAPDGMDVNYSKITNGSYESRPDPLFPVNLQWMDGGTVTYPDGTATGGLLEIHYCETIAGWFARAVAEDYQDHYQMFSGTQAIELPPLDVDYAAAFYDRHGLPRVVLVEGSTVVCTRFSMADEYGYFTPEAWAQAMAQRLTLEGGT